MSHQNPKSKLNEICMYLKIALPQYISKPIAKGDELVWHVSLTIFGKKITVPEASSKKEGEQRVAEIALGYAPNLPSKKQLLAGAPLLPPKKVILPPPVFSTNELELPPLPPPKRVVLPPPVISLRSLDELELPPPPPPEEIPPKKISPLLSPKFFEASAPTAPTKKMSKRIAVIIDLENLPKFPKDIEDLVGIPNLDVYAVCSSHYHGEAFAEVNGVKKILHPALGANASDLCMTMFVGALLAKGDYDEYLLASRDKFVTPVVEIIRYGVEPSEWEPKSAHIISTREHLLKRLERLEKLGIE